MAHGATLLADYVQIHLKLKGHSLEWHACTGEMFQLSSLYKNIKKGCPSRFCTLNQARHITFASGWMVLLLCSAIVSSLEESLEIYPQYIS